MEKSSEKKSVQWSVLDETAMGLVTIWSSPEFPGKAEKVASRESKLRSCSYCLLPVCIAQRPPLMTRPSLQWFRSKLVETRAGSLDSTKVLQAILQRNTVQEPAAYLAGKGLREISCSSQAAHCTGKASQAFPKSSPAVIQLQTSQEKLHKSSLRILQLYGCRLQRESFKSLPKQFLAADCTRKSFTGLP